MKNRKLKVESLEGRHLMAVFGNPWPEPEKLTISFVPDGTQAGELDSSLFQKLDGAASRAAWQKAALRAFQTWAQHADINFSVVEDNGQTLGGQAGEGGALQGGKLQGDIRLAAVDLAHTELAVAAPFDLLSDWSGDVLLNTDYNFRLSGTSGYDLFTVLLQEAGHTLGLANSFDSTSAMYSQYMGRRTGPSAEDVSALQSLYGVRTPDRFEGVKNNNAFARATWLSFIEDADQFRDSDPLAGARPFVAAGDLTTTKDVDFYKFTVPPDLHDFTVELRASGVSLVGAKVTVYNAAKQVVATASATDPFQNDLSLFVSRSTYGGDYFVKVQAAKKDAFGVGAYRLAVGKETHEALFPSEGFYINDDRPDDDEGPHEPPQPLAARTSELGPEWDYAHRASISYPGDIDAYRVSAPLGPAGSTSAMVITVWGLEADKLQPRVSVFSEGSATPLAAQVLRSDRGAMTIQIEGAPAGETFDIRVEAADPQGSNKEGNYLLGVDFVANPIVLDSFASQTLTPSEPQSAVRLELAETRLFHFLLAAGGPATDAVRATIYNSARNVVASFVAVGGTAQSIDLLLAPGAYTVRFAAGTFDSEGLLAPLSFDFSGLVRNDPIGPQPIDPFTQTPPSTTPPTQPPPPQPPVYDWTIYDEFPEWIEPEDPYGDPWVGL